MSVNEGAAATNGPRTLAGIRELLDRMAVQAAENDARAEREMAALRARMEETARQMQETDRRMDRRMQETDRQMKETDRRLKKAEGLFTSQWGKLMESLVEGDLVALLRARGIDVTRTSQRLKGRENGEHYEFDILAENGAEAVVVEVKTTLRPEDVSRFLAKMSRHGTSLRYRPGQTIYGAVAYLRGDESVVTYANGKGLFVIRATGSSASVVNPPDFEPRALG